MGYELWSLIYLFRYSRQQLIMPEFLVVPVVVLVHKQPFPRVRLVILVEAGTHLIFDALMCPYRIGERVRALKLLRGVKPGMLLMWDRGLHSYEMVQSTLAQGCDYLGRIPANVKFLAEEPFADGSYLNLIYPPGKLRKRSAQPLKVRVIEYAIEHQNLPQEQLTYRAYY